MLFNSFQFAFFFAAFLILYICANHAWQNRLILVASCIFYGAWDWRFLGLLFATIGIDYWVTRQLDREADPRTRKHLLMLSLIGNLGMLGFFKYFNFFAESLHELLSLVGLPVPFAALQIVLPVGISFYTLHTLGYVLDVYHRRERHVSSFVEFACFVAFFPLLVAGPIVRIGTMRHQFAEPRVMTAERAGLGASLCLIGLVQKVVVADNLSVVVDRAFSDIAKHNPAELLVSLYAFAFQIYGDFAGYSNIAIGLAVILGFSLPANFDRPYHAIGLREFWRRWHISLSMWIRDYVYIPLGGNRSGGTYRNLLLSMGLCGLWHGASWTMVLWGLYHGALLSGQHALSNVVSWRPQRNLTGTVMLWGLRAFGLLLTFHLVCAGWLLFRAPTLADAGRYAWAMVSFDKAWSLSSAWWAALGFIGIAAIIDLLHLLASRVDFYAPWPPVLRGAVVAAMIGALFVFGGYVDVPFIYFQF